MVMSRRTPRRQGATPLLPTILSPVFAPAPRNTPSIPAPTQTSGTAGDCEVDSEQDAFAWTTLAAKVLLEVRFKDMKSRFQGPKSSAQLSSAWALLASEVSRLSDITVKPTQCKSKIKYMQKQYRAYRVAQQDTEKPLREPPCYDTMREVWSDLSDMSSDAGRIGAARDLESQRGHERDGENELDEQEAVQTEGSETEGRQTGGSNDRRQGWRNERPSKRHKSVTLAEGVMAVCDSMEKIADALKGSRQACDAPYVQPSGTNNEILQSLRDLTESVQAQTAVLMLLVRASSERTTTTTTWAESSDTQ